MINRSSVELVKEFHAVFGHHIGRIPEVPVPVINAFRKNFIQEELGEAMQACSVYDVIGLADALGDIQYVLDGWFVNAGLANFKDAIMEEIHRSNMSKTCKSVEEAEATIDNLVSLALEVDPETKRLDFHYKQVGADFIVYRTADGKVMKSINYFPPDLKTVIYGENRDSV